MVKDLIDAKRDDEIIFTSGGTESINHAIKGAFLYHQKQKTGRNVIITSAM